ncbi:MAG: hypothetical protein AAFO58_09620, partial [Pseudomonadota bacterium]
MIDLFTSPASLPFAIALTVVAALFVLEIISALIGGTILGAGSDGPDLDMDVDTDFDLSIEPDMDIEVEAATDAVDTSELSGGLFTWIGARDVPFLIWLV